ncbi:MAG: alpha/beta hydrolase, partial [Candidatus Omnitrophica bacterium]|nr:alpha/beta hydrolase [Candidatus Omnitrophota bacterium]
MSIHLAYRFPADVAGIVALAPTIYYDGWALPKAKIFLNLAWNIPALRNSINIREGWPYGLKDEETRNNIERFYKGAEASKFDNQVLAFGSPFFPLANLYQHHLFTKVVKDELALVKAPILVIHAKEDDMTSPKNARYVYENIGSARKSLLLLDNSYHMITIDKDKDKVAEEVVKFFQNSL